MTALDRFTTSFSFREDGHATDLALSALSDGEDRLLPEEVLLHVDQCAPCIERMADLAFASLALDRKLAGLRPVSHPFPVLAVVFGLLLGSLPAAGLLLRSPWALANLGEVLTAIRLMVRGLRAGLPHALEATGGSLLLASCFASALLLSGGLLIARVSSATPPFGDRA